MNKIPDRYEKVGICFRLKCVKGLNKIPGHYDNWKYMNPEFKKKIVFMKNIISSRNFFLESCNGASKQFIIYGPIVYLSYTYNIDV